MAIHADTRLGEGDPTERRSGALASDLFEQHSEMVLSVCRVLLVDPGEAEDAMQQTFLYAYRSILAGSEPRQPAAWLATIARNECLSRLRARTREPKTGPASGGAPGTRDALNAAIAREDLHALGRTIRELPAPQREALLLHEFCGMPYSEVAAAIGVTESAIGSLLFRARTHLRVALSRTWASVPIPGLWNAVDHLLARGPATATAMPVVAKLGTAAVAVGLTAGAAVVVDHDVRPHHRPPPPAPTAHRSAAPAAAATPETHLARVAVAASAPRAVRPAAAVPSGRARGHAARVEATHRTRSLRTVPARHPSQERIAPVSPVHPGRPDAATHARGRAGPASGGARPAHASAAGKKAEAGRSRAPGKALRTHSGKTSKPAPSRHPRSAGSGSASGGRPASNGHGTATPATGPESTSGAGHGNGNSRRER